MLTRLFLLHTNLRRNCTCSVNLNVSPLAVRRNAAEPRSRKLAKRSKKSLQKAWATAVLVSTVPPRVSHHSSGHTPLSDTPHHTIPSLVNQSHATNNYF